MHRVRCRHMQFSCQNGMNKWCLSSRLRNNLQGFACCGRRVSSCTEREVSSDVYILLSCRSHYINPRARVFAERRRSSKKITAASILHLNQRRPESRNFFSTSYTIVVIPKSGEIIKIRGPVPANSPRIPEVL